MLINFENNQEITEVRYKKEFISDLSEMYKNFFKQCEIDKKDINKSCNQSNITCPYNFVQLTEGYDKAKNKILLVWLETINDGFKKT